MKKLMAFVIVLPLMFMVSTTWAAEKKEVAVKKEKVGEVKKEDKNESKKEDKAEHHSRSAH